MATLQLCKIEPAVVEFLCHRRLLHELGPRIRGLQWPHYFLCHEADEIRSKWVMLTSIGERRLRIPNNWKHGSLKFVRNPTHVCGRDTEIILQNDHIEALLLDTTSEDQNNYIDQDCLDEIRLWLQLDCGD
jgi:hypothetical protein